MQFLFKNAWNMLRNVFNIIYINTDIPIGAEHILIPIFLSDISLFFLFSFFYCFSELYNFTNYSKSSLKLKYKLNSDKCYKRILGLLTICTALTFITFLITIILFSLTGYLKWFLIVLFLFCTILALYNIKKIINNLKVFLLNFHINIVRLLAAWVLLNFLFLSFGLSQSNFSEKNYLILKFNNENTLDLDFQFENKIPKEIVIQSDETPIKITKEDFLMTYVEVTKENFNDDATLTPLTNQFIYKESFYEYHYKTNLDNLIHEGKNTIVITFEIKNIFSTKKSYKIVNQINYVNGKYELVKKDFNVSL